MGDKDFAISTVAAPQVGSISKKPSYLITLDGMPGAKSKIARFITLDKPDLLVGFVQAKGVFSEVAEEEILTDFANILHGTPKESFLDIMFPVHKIIHIRSLVFNANKPSTLAK